MGCGKLVLLYFMGANVFYPAEVSPHSHAEGHSTRHLPSSLSLYLWCLKPSECAFTTSRHAFYDKNAFCCCFNTGTNKFRRRNTSITSRVLSSRPHCCPRWRTTKDTANAAQSLSNHEGSHIGQPRNASSRGGAAVLLPHERVGKEAEQLGPSCTRV